VNLRYLVPALGVVALTSTTGFAEDKASAVSFAGWVDTILNYSSSDTVGVTDLAGTAKDETGGTLAFSAVGSIKTMWKVTDALSAKINLWFDPGADGLNMREAYFTWAFNDNLSWTMGKYIDHIGWLSAEPTGLYTVNASLIGYTSTYGNDVIGTYLNFAPKDSPFSGSFHVVNGYYTDTDADNTGLFAGRDPNRENTDMGFGLDLIYALPDNKGSINLEFAYDMHSGDDASGDLPDNAAGGNFGGDVFLAGLNATVTPTAPLLIGAEVQYLTYDESESAAGVDGADAADRLQFMVLGNYKLTTATPMSVSAMVQYVQVEFDAAAQPETESRLGVSAALLTNPLGSSNFGLNFEIGFFDVTDADGVAGADSDGLALAVEGLVTF
jgi:hypothetical protein